MIFESLCNHATDLSRSRILPARASFTSKSLPPNIRGANIFNVNNTEDWQTDCDQEHAVATAVKRLINAKVPEEPSNVASGNVKSRKMSSTTKDRQITSQQIPIFGGLGNTNVNFNSKMITPIENRPYVPQRRLLRFRSTLM